MFHLILRLMYHLFIFAVIESFYIDIQGFVYFDNSEAVIFGKASFDHYFHCKVMDAMPETVIPGVMVPLDDGYDFVALLKYRNDFFCIADTKFLANARKSIQQLVDEDHSRQIVFLQFLPEPFLLGVQSNLPES